MKRRVRSYSFIFLYLGSLPHSLKHSHLKLENSFVADSVLKQAEAVDEQIDEKLFTLEGNTGIGIFGQLDKLFISQRISISRPISQPIFDIPLSLLCLLGQTSHMRVLVRPQIRQQSGNRNIAIVSKLLESVIDGGQSLWSYVISNIIDKLAISDAIGPRECIFDCSYLLRGQEQATCIEQQIEGMVRETALIAGIKFRDLGVEGNKIVVGFTEELEFEFIIDLCQGVDPVHAEVIIIIALNTFISIYIAIIQ